MGYELNGAEIVYINIDNRKLFSDFINKNKHSTLEHYMLLERMESNHSFLIYYHNKPAVLIPLYFEKNNTEASFLGMSLPPPLFSDDIILINKTLKKIIILVLKKLDDICVENNIKLIKLNYMTSIFNSKAYRMLHKELKKSFYQQYVFDMGILNLKNKNLNVDFSKGLKSDIKKWNTKINVDFFNFELSPLKYDEFVQKLEGYSDDDMDIIYSLYVNNMVEFCTLSYQDNYLGFVLFLIDKSNKSLMYYNAFKVDVNIPIHSIGVYQFIERYIEKEYDQMLFGVLSSSFNLLYIPSNKHRKITSFKNSFGGELEHMSVYQKFFSVDDYKNYMIIQTERIINNFKEKSIET